MNKIVIIGVYFGMFPNNFDLWLKSCEFNKDYDFLIFTNQKVEIKPRNVTFIDFKINDFNELARKKLKIQSIDIKKPYKCCDFKPVYGIIFDDYIKDYDYWGHCDFDLIFGDLNSALGNKIWNHYDKILPLGHLSFYKNTVEVNERYKLETGNKLNYIKAFTSDSFCAFDEFDGMMSIYEKYKFSYFKKRVFADISSVYKRFKLGMKDKNYKYQVFYWENGKVFRAYYDNKSINKDEFIYIHFKQRKNLPISISNISKCKSFYITNRGFIEKSVGLPSLDDIKEYNQYYGVIKENFEYLMYRYNNLIKKIKNLKMFKQ